jgi:hypothetical protein
MTRALARLLAAVLLWTALVAQDVTPPAIERLAGGARAICGHPGCDEAGRVTVQRGTTARVIARRDREYLGTPHRSWRLVIESRRGTWAVTSPLGEDATICTGDDHMTWRFALIAIVARDVMSGPEPEVIVLFHDGRNLGAAQWATVCTVDGAPRCTAPIPVDASVDDVFTVRDHAQAIGGEVALTLL